MVVLALATFVRPARADEEDPWPKAAEATADLDRVPERLNDVLTTLMEGSWSSQAGDVRLFAPYEKTRDTLAAEYAEALATAALAWEKAGFVLAPDATTTILRIEARDGPTAAVVLNEGAAILLREAAAAGAPEAPRQAKRPDGPVTQRDLVVEGDRATVHCDHGARLRAYAAGPGSAANAFSRRAAWRWAWPEGTPVWLREGLIAWAEESAFPATREAPLHLCGGAAGKAYSAAALFDPKAAPSPAQVRVIGRVLASLVGTASDVPPKVASIAASADRGAAALSAAFGRDAAAALAEVTAAAPSAKGAACDASQTVPCVVCRGAGRAEATCSGCQGLSFTACPSCRGDGLCWSPYCVHGVHELWSDDVDRECRLCVNGWTHCAPCKSTGRTPCKACSGRGRATWPCLACSGSGRTPCPDAGVAPAREREETVAKGCPWCGGKPVLVPCGTCRGAGYAGCTTCRGSLRKMCPKCAGAGCKHCESRGAFRCADCEGGQRACECAGKGTKRLEPAGCPACSGKARRPTPAEAAARLGDSGTGITAEESKANAEMLAKAVAFLLLPGPGGEFALREFRLRADDLAGDFHEATIFSDAFVLWTLFTAGIGPEDPRLAEAWRVLRSGAKKIGDGTYAAAGTQAASFTLRALVAGGLRADDPLVTKLVDRLAKAQRPSGYWAQDLESKDPGDPFSSIFPLESLWLARRKGVRVPGDVWSKATSAAGRLSSVIAKSRQKDGWIDATDVASSAAVAVLARAGAAASKSIVEEVRSLPPVQQALAWLDRHFSLERCPSVNGSAVVTLPTDASFAAYLYALQRLCQLLSIDRIGGERWYAAGARRLREMQLPDGSFEEMGPGRLNGPVRTTAAAVLFLVKATPPLTESGHAPAEGRDR
jgi:hypothetical protein